MQAKNKNKIADKNDENWKIASEDFRSVIKAIKKNELEHID
jgi:hypothetical protein